MDDAFFPVGGDGHKIFGAENSPGSAAHYDAAKDPNRIVQAPNVLTEFSITAVTEGIDAVGEVTIRVEPTTSNGAHSGDDYSLTQVGMRQRTYSGHGAETDIIVASAKAYMSALNKMLTVVKAEAKA